MGVSGTHRIPRNIEFTFQQCAERTNKMACLQGQESVGVGTGSFGAGKQIPRYFPLDIK